MKSYKDRIRDLREDRELTQTQIAEVLGIAQNVYSRYEVGKNEMPIHHLTTLATYYKVSTDYILGLTDDPTPPQKSKFVRPESTTSQHGLFHSR